MVKAEWEKKRKIGSGQGFFAMVPRQFAPFTNKHF